MSTFTIGARKVLNSILAVVFAAVSVLGTALVLGGCTKQDDSKTLRIWSAVPLMNEGYEAALKIDPTNYSALYTKFIFEKFKAEYPDITIRYEAKGWAEALNENIIRTAAVSQPDIIGTETYTQNLVGQGYLAPVEWDKETYDNFLPFTLESSTRDGKLYATPIYTNTTAFLYNETILLAAGCPTEIDDDGAVKLLVPETWPEVLHCCEKVNAYLNSNTFLGHGGGMNAIEKTKYGAYIINNARGIAAGFRGELYLQLAGGSMIKEGALQSSVTANEINLDTDKNAEGFSLMSELYGYSPTGAYTLEETNVATALLTGDVAMTVDIPAWLAAGAAANVHLKASQVPVFTYDQSGKAVMTPFAYSAGNRDGVDNGTTKGRSANVAIGNVAYAITQKSDKKEMAQRFIEICLSDEAQAYLLGLNYRAPSTKSGLAYVLDDEKLSGLKTAVNEGAYNSAVANRDLMYQTLLDARDSVDGTVKIAGGLACFSTNINNCWTRYETFMRKIYNDRVSGSALRTELKKLSDGLKGELR